jgi:hypothetical protein
VNEGRESIQDSDLKLSIIDETVQQIVLYP